MNASATTTPQVLQQTVTRLGPRVALRHKHLGLWRDISWDAYFARVRQLACALTALGVEKGDRVAIIGDNGPAWVMADLGIQCAGGVSVGIYATSAAPQVAYVVQHSEAVCLFVENEEQLDKWLLFRERAPRLRRVVVWDLEGLRHFQDPLVTTFEDFLEAGRRAEAADPGVLPARMRQIVPGDLAVLIYTSGTTGPPKGAMLTHANVTWMARAVTRDNPIHERDEVLSFLPLCHIFERLFSVFVHIAHGYVVNFVEKPDTVGDNMVEVSPTVGYAVPRIWEKYASGAQIRMTDATWFKRRAFALALAVGRRRADRIMRSAPVPPGLNLLYGLAHLTVLRKLKKRLGLDRMRMAYSGAAPIAPDILHFFQSIGVALMEGYGQTEGTGVTCLSRAGRMRFGTVGPALPGTEVRIAADGEILVKSPGVFAGYFKDPEATAQTIRDGWLYSGDIGELDAEGYLRITDRKKDIIVTAGGKNITPQLIENKLKASPYVNDAVVIGDRRRFLAALIMIDEEHVVKYAQDHKIQFATYRDLTAHAEIRALIQREVDQVNATLARVEHVRKFALLPKRLYEEDGEVTPTMKVKRQHVNAAFRDLIEDLYR
jgi:long-chain acyl-CoA synthetase